MEITVFAKKATAHDGKTFVRYLTTLKRKDGTTQTMAVKFREDAGKPKLEDCPTNLIIEKRDANISTHDYVREDTGETGISYTLWVSAWTQGEPYVDTSLDEYDV